MSKTLDEYFAKEFEEYLKDVEIRRKKEQMDKIKKRFMKIPCPICSRETPAIDKYCRYCGADLDYRLANFLTY